MPAPPKTPDVFEGDPATLRVALCQVFTEPWAMEENLARTLETLEAAAKGGAELAITPECVLHGYAFPKKGEDPKRLLEAAEPLDGPRIAKVRALAKARLLSIVLGFAERGADGLVRNAAALISRDGDIRAIYRKVHLRPFESPAAPAGFAAGDRFVVEDVESAAGKVRLGLFICFDREVPESARTLRALGAEILACPVATRVEDLLEEPGHATNELVTRCRAAENETFIAVVNHAGRQNGRSYIVGPGGEKIAQMDETPGVAVVNVPVGAVRRIRQNPRGWMAWGFRRPDAYSR